jgi:outer membrane protein insertion porin family
LVSAKPVSLANMRMAWGWGIRWFSPVGPLRFEWGVPIAPRKNEQTLVFEFTIGNSF